MHSFVGLVRGVQLRYIRRPITSRTVPALCAAVRPFWTSALLTESITRNLSSLQNHSPAITSAKKTDARLTIAALLPSSAALGRRQTPTAPADEATSRRRRWRHRRYNGADGARRLRRARNGAPHATHFKWARLRPRAPRDFDRGCGKARRRSRPRKLRDREPESGRFDLRLDEINPRFGPAESGPRRFSGCRAGTRPPRVEYAGAVVSEPGAAAQKLHAGRPPSSAGLYRSSCRWSTCRKTATARPALPGSHAPPSCCAPRRSTPRNLRTPRTFELVAPGVALGSLLAFDYRVCTRAPCARHRPWPVRGQHARRRRDGAGTGRGRLAARGVIA